MKEEHVIWKILEIEEEATRSYNPPPEPCSEEEIKAAEKALGVTFHEGYKRYLQTYGEGGVSSFEIYGLRLREKENIHLINPDPLSVEGSWSVVHNTYYYRKQDWPKSYEWYVVSDDGFGNPFGIDRQGQVWLSDHDSCELIKTACSFEDFLYQIVTDTLWQPTYLEEPTPWPDEWFKKHRPDLYN